MVKKKKKRPPLMVEPRHGFGVCRDWLKRHQQCSKLLDMCTD